jgi:hypothetical protein
MLSRLPRGHGLLSGLVAMMVGDVCRGEEASRGVVLIGTYSWNIA